MVSCSELATLFKAWETAGSPLKCMLTCNMLCTRLLEKESMVKIKICFH